MKYAEEASRIRQVAIDLAHVNVSDKQSGRRLLAAQEELDAIGDAIDPVLTLIRPSRTVELTEGEASYLDRQLAFLGRTAAETSPSHTIRAKLA